MKYNKEMFDQTLRASNCSFLDFMHPMQYDESILEYAEKYLDKLLGTPEIISLCYGDADRYYYMIASHAFYAGFCIANWEKTGQARDASLRSVMSFDSIAIMRMNWKDVNTERVDLYLSFVYEFAINDFKGMFGQSLVIDNENEYILGMLMAFFALGYKMIPEYFDEDDDDDYYEDDDE